MSRDGKSWRHSPSPFDPARRWPTRKKRARHACDSQTVTRFISRTLAPTFCTVQARTGHLYLGERYPGVLLHEKTVPICYLTRGEQRLRSSFPSGGFSPLRVDTRLGSHPARAREPEEVLTGPSASPALQIARKNASYCVGGAQRDHWRVKERHPCFRATGDDCPDTPYCLAAWSSRSFNIRPTPPQKAYIRRFTPRKGRTVGSDKNSFPIRGPTKRGQYGSAAIPNFFPRSSATFSPSVG